MTARDTALTLTAPWHVVERDGDLHVEALPDGPHVCLVGRATWSGVRETAQRIVDDHGRALAVVVTPDLAAIEARAAQVAHALETAQETRVLVARKECAPQWAKIHDDAWREAARESAADVPALLAHITTLRAQHAADVAAASRSTRESCAATLRARAECLRRYAYEATAKADATEYTHDASEVDACAAIVASVALPYLRNAERVLVAERARAEAAEAECVRLRAIVESVRSARAVSAAAAERYTAAWDAVGTMPPTPAQSEEIAAALLAAYEAGDALTAALDAAGEGR